MAVRGPISPRRLSEDALAALQSGDPEALLRASKAEFGGFMVMMATDDDDADDDDDDDSTSGADDDDDDTRGKDKHKNKGDDADDDDDDDRERLRKRMKAADRRRAEAERELQALKDKDKSELERAQSALSEMEKTVESLQSEVKTMRLQNAFLTANKHSWHDPDVALSLAESKKYLEDVVDEDGEVDRKALGKALERLAKEHTYLVKSEDKNKDKDDEPDLPSGEASGRRSDNNQDDKAKKQAMRSRFPALNR